MVSWGGHCWGGIQFARKRECSTFTPPPPFFFLFCLSLKNPGTALTGVHKLYPNNVTRGILCLYQWISIGLWTTIILRNRRKEMRQPFYKPS